MKLAFLGTGAFGVPALEAALAAQHEVIAVISQPDRPAGRGLGISVTPMHAAADRLKLAHVQTADINSLDPVTITRGVELFVVVAFGQKLGPSVLAAAPRGCINIHASLLPRYRGAAPYQWAILNGDARTGVTIFQINERWDAGPIWSRVETPIGELETADELHDRLSLLGADALANVLKCIESGTATPLAQDAAQATRAPKLTKADARIDWSQPAGKVVRRIHGLWSWPAASCQFVSRTGKHELVQLARARCIDDKSQPTTDLAAGTFGADQSVQTGCGRVQILEIKPAGGKLMPFSAYANGRRIGAGDRLAPLDS